MQLKKIIFDISILGKGFMDEASRTGIYRVTEEILKGLLARKEIELYPFASQLNIEECLAYIRGSFAHTDLEDRFIMPIKSSIISGFRTLLAWISTRGTGGIGKIIQKCINHYGSILGIFSISPYLIVHLNKYDAYFSAYHPFPAQVCKSEIKKVLLIHDLIPLLLPSSYGYFARHLQKQLLRHFPADTNIICNSEVTKRDLIKYRPDITEPRVLYFGASEIFRPTSESPSLPKQVKKYILAVSSLNPRKNFIHIIRAFIELIHTYKFEDLYLVIAGPNGWREGEIFHELKQNADLAEKIIMVGYVDDADLPKLYSHAMCFVMMSLYEGFGLPVLEAMKCGAPVIVSDNSSLPEVTANVGIKLPPSDRNALVDALYSLYMSSEMRESMAHASLKRAEQFSWKNFTDGLLSVLVA